MFHHVVITQVSQFFTQCFSYFLPDVLHVSPKFSKKFLNPPVFSTFSPHFPRLSAFPGPSPGRRFEHLDLATAQLQHLLIGSLQDLQGHLQETPFLNLLVDYPLLDLMGFNQWEFQDPKMEVLYHIRPYLMGFNGIFDVIFDVIFDGIFDGFFDGIL